MKTFRRTPGRSILGASSIGTTTAAPRHWTRVVLSSLLIAAIIGAGAPTVVAARAESRGLLVRKNVLELTKGERQTFVKAVRLLKRTPSPYDESKTLSYYDQFVEWHLSLYRCSGTDFDIRAGHGGPFFLPWHRAFVRLFEKALQEVSGEKIAVPYWDWSSKASTDSVFADDFMGGDGDAAQGYAVTTGPFRKGQWNVTLAPEMLPWSTSFQPHLVRRWGTENRFPLPPVADVAWALKRPNYDVAPYDMRSDPNLSFRNALEGWWRTDPTTGTRYSDPIDYQHCGPDGHSFGFRDGGGLHNRVHGWTGGIIGDPDGPTLFGTMVLPTSPSDPVFFLHHSNIDRLWAKWQSLNPGTTFQPADNAEDELAPLPSTGGAVLSPASVESPAGLGYGYSDYTDSDDELVDPARQGSVNSSPAANQTPTASVPNPGATTFAFGCQLPV